MSNTINEAFENVSLTVDNVKSNLATAITQKGVQTSNTDTFAKMTENVGKITSTSGNNGKKYGIGDIIDGDDIETYRKVQKAWEKKIYIDGRFCIYNNLIYFIHNKNLITINVNTGDEVSRKSGFNLNGSVLKIDNENLFIVSLSTLLKVNLQTLEILKTKTYDLFFKDFLIDDNHIYLISSRGKLYKVNKNTLNYISASNSLIDEFDPDFEIKDFTVGKDYIYISYVQNGFNKLVKISKESLTRDTLTSFTIPISKILADGQGKLYTFGDGYLAIRDENDENLSTSIHTEKTHMDSVEEIQLSHSEIFLIGKGKASCLDKNTLNFLYKIDLNNNYYLRFFAKNDNEKYFYQSFISGNLNLTLEQAINEFYYKVLR